jgi:hypothetical protein
MVDVAGQDQAGPLVPDLRPRAHRGAAQAEGVREAPARRRSARGDDPHAGVPEFADEDALPLRRGARVGGGAREPVAGHVVPPLRDRRQPGEAQGRRVRASAAAREGARREDPLDEVPGLARPAPRALRGGPRVARPRAGPRRGRVVQGVQAGRVARDRARARGGARRPVPLRALPRRGGRRDARVLARPSLPQGRDPGQARQLVPAVQPPRSPRPRAHARSRSRARRRMLVETLPRLGIRPLVAVRRRP